MWDNVLFFIATSFSLQWFGVLIVLLYRFVIAALCTGFVTWSISYYPSAAVLLFLTNWGFFFVTLYFICATMVTAIHYKNQRKQPQNRARGEKENENGFKMAAKTEDKETSSSTIKPCDGWVTNPVDDDSEVVFTGDDLEASRATPMRWYQEALWVIYNIASVAAVFVTISFWLLLYIPFGRGQSLGPIVVILHAANSIVMVGDTMLSSIPVRLFHVVYPMLCSIAYIISTVIYWGYSGTGVYPQTDYTVNPVFSAVSILCLFFIGLPLCQSLVFGLYCLRSWIKTKCLK